MTGVALEGLEEYEAAVAAGRTARAVAVVDELLSGGTSATAVLLEVIGEVQRRVGQRWLVGEWSVAQEHAATSIAAAAAQSVVRRLETAPADRGTVVLACPEREWHALPALLTSGVLREAGWEVLLLGASTPASRLGRYLHDLGPVATGVSCSVLKSLPAARRVIEASTGAGIPVLAGGAAFGSGSQWALALGATAWAPDAATAVGLLDRLPPRVPEAAPLDREVAGELAALDRLHDQLTTDAAREWRPRGVDADVARELVEEWLWAVGAALLVDDPQAVEYAEAWISEVLAHRSGRREDVAALRRAAGNRLVEYPTIARILRQLS
ncbi:MAG TPA: cobalamin-dependent protein [Nocardioidaceae bacterium]|nr:cobalamin-dependent protein [Nocardioidaceae bacterium]